MNNKNAQILIDLLKDDRLEEVIDLLVESFPNEQNIVQLKGSLQNIRNSYLNGELTNDETVKHRNILRTRAFNIIKDIEDSGFEKEQSVQTYPFPVNFFLTIVLLGGIIFIFFIIFNFFSRYELPHLPPISFPSETAKTQHQGANTTNATQRTATPYLEEKMITGFDQEGRKAEYIVFIVRNFNWVLGEISMSEKNGEESEICEHLTTIGVEARLNREDFKGIICFGNTSFEEDLSLPKSKRKTNEEDRAEFRATFLALCVSQVLKNKTPIFKANLGKYNLMDEVTNYQREIIIVGIVQTDENVINEEALFNGLEDWHLIENWEIDIREYSKINQNKIPIERFLN